MWKIVVPAIIWMCILPSLCAGGNENIGDSKGAHLYAKKCATCHGTLGDGNGPSAAFLNSKPADFTRPGFWKDDIEKKVLNAVKKGKGEMPSIHLEQQEIRAIIGYIRNFSRPPEKVRGKK